MEQYDEVFFEYINSGSKRSAKYLLPKLLSYVEVESVLDVGCGQGAWLSVWKELGVEKITGIDGKYVDQEKLLCPSKDFIACDLAQPFNLETKFELVQSLEVAEHLPEASAEGFVASLVRHGDMVLFSAAPKGQGGDHHVNEQDYQYWHNKFAKHGYVLLDCIRPQIESEQEIKPWYRYNTFLYVLEKRVPELPEELAKYMIPLGGGIDDVSPPLYKLRKLIIRLLPVFIVTQLAKLNERRIAESFRG